MPGAHLTVSQLSTGLKILGGNFILTIILTMPVTTATPERSFRVKTYLRSTIRAERSSGLALLHAYRDKSIDTDKVVREFCARPRPYILECYAKAALSLRSTLYCIEVGKYNKYVK